MNSKVNCKCGAEIHIEAATTRLDVKTGTREYVCERCADWFHHFGESKLGRCYSCGDFINKGNCLWFADNNWGSFYCGDDCSIVGKQHA